MSWKQMLSTLAAGDFVYMDLFPLIAAAYVTRRWEGDPLWLLVVGPPSSGKSCCAKLFSEGSEITRVSSLTPAGLISGWGGDAVDPSLLAEIDDHLLVAKDFGTILSMGWQTSNQIFGILREAYDGHVSRKFGMRLVREYWSHFNFVACTTEACERFASYRAQLGERFLRYAHTAPELPDDVVPVSDALIGAVSSWADELGNEEYEPTLTERRRLSRLARVCALLRTEVIHNGASQEILEIPQFEQPSRIAFQLKKLYGGLVVVTESSEEALRLTRKVAHSVVAPRKLRLLKLLLGITEPTETTQPKLAERLRLGYGVVRRLTQDFFALGLLERELQDMPKAFLWQVEKKFAKMLRKFFADE